MIIELGWVKDSSSAIFYFCFLLQVVILSDVSLGYLFSNEKPTEMYTNDEHRALMDDLMITKDSVSIF